MKMICLPAKSTCHKIQAIPGYRFLLGGVWERVGIDNEMLETPPPQQVLLAMVELIMIDKKALGTMMNLTYFVILRHKCEVLKSPRRID